MMRSRKMKRLELTVLARDVDRVIEFLGRRGLMHFSGEGTTGADAHFKDEGVFRHIRDQLEKLQALSTYLGIELPTEPEETSSFPTEAEDSLVTMISDIVTLIRERELGETQEKRKVEEALHEVRSFANLNAPFAELDQLSYLTLRIGRLDPADQAEVRESLVDRAVIIPLGKGDDRVVAAASRKGRFALDSELKKRAFIPIAIPEGYRGVPSEIVSGLESRLANTEHELGSIAERKKQLGDEYGPELRRLSGSYLMAAITEELKERLVATQSVYFLSGWVPLDSVTSFVVDIERFTGGRVAIRTFNPEEVPEVQEGKEKVPVSLKHGAFVKGFENVVFSYGAPLYGTIDPTPFVAVFFAFLFGIMFGDLGQGFVLMLLGILTRNPRVKALVSFKSYSTPLIAVGITSMIMGLLNGAVFANEELLIRPTQAVLGFFMHLTGQVGEPPERILHLMPEKGNIAKLFYFFGFTVGVGILLNSIGLWINVINQVALKKYEKAFFSKNGLAGILLFWYTLGIVVRVLLLGGSFAWFDMIGIMLPALGIFFGPVIWRIIARERPILEHGLLVFIMEGFVEILETASTYISNTVSFLRVGAFALSHAVLSFIVFTLSGMVSSLVMGPLFSLIIMIFGNVVIILLEGMIVAIQVVRLQYYEFFSKFFTEMGVMFVPFSFRQELAADTKVSKE
ncbi:MAG: V-type ATP synthase subunit I [Treponema sp.]|jgi:V/A-type H+-transporting ATPase subunit I|nr:V-type ATP synthase subunit I [Treponema sp.]